ncbi:MAG: nucleoside hydrolase, partial [Nitrososphaeria archaeon]
LDVTANPKVWISKNEINNLKETKRSSVLRSIVRKYIEIYGAFVPHDPIAAYYLINPESFQIEKHCVKIKTGKFRGMTSVDNSSENCTKSSIAIDVDAAMFKNAFLKSMEV